MAAEAKTMKETNTLNVYKGPESIRDYFDPDTAPPLPLVEVPSCLNPYHADGVRIFAKMMSMHPANNVKCMPALNLLEKSVKPDVTKTIVEYSSGSTVLSMSLVGRAIYGLDDIRAFLSNKTSIAKIRLMQLFGINITLFSGPSQPEPLDERGGIRAAQRLGNETSDSLNPNQYENENNWKSHVRWTGPQILRQLPEINLICAGMGTSGTMTGLGTYFKGAKPDVVRLGVCTAAGDRVPGPRSYALLGPVTFPWKSSVDHVEEVGSYESYRLSLELCRQGLVCGPSSGFNLRGLYQYIEKQKAEGNLGKLAGPDGLINCVFLCCDLPYQYVNEYFDKLDDSCFPPVKNEELLNVDLYRYDEKWEWEASKALQGYFHVNSEQMDLLTQRAPEPVTGEIPSLRAALQPRDDAAVLDLRQPADFDRGRLPGSVNLPLAQPGAASPFSDPAILSRLWTELDGEFSSTGNGELQGRLRGRETLVVCYDGDSARVAASVMRAKGYEANSLRAGLDGLVAMLSTAPPQDACGVTNESEQQQQQAGSWLQLSASQHQPAASVEVAASNASSEMRNMQQAAVIV
ncbi:cysteine synthase B [Cordyceps fumosorosea ARSEF 2679]|uniref:Cysteine synthase B n=1 Tax=Cordyceps fumosorosea (strain ARSEF 2679) TaxID=1081104 RepID=A0A167TRD4_CORFA|nr:cysteine synthase B [Cordyceps fumosorosea ARSEF 2679]OAA60866.1 cysteine synthase B [Cordyceps fumosorosea ARSEF 2679]